MSDIMQTDTDKLNSIDRVNIDEKIQYIENWKNRRTMAYISLVSLIIMMLILLFAPIPNTRLSVIAEPIIWFFFMVGSIVGSYMGFSAWASKPK